MLKQDITNSHFILEIDELHNETCLVIEFFESLHQDFCVPKQGRPLQKKRITLQTPDNYDNVSVESDTFEQKTYLSLYTTFHLTSVPHLKLVVLSIS